MKTKDGESTRARRASQPAKPALSEHGLTQKLVDLQRKAGNEAVTMLIANQAHAPGRDVVVQTAPPASGAAATAAPASAAPTPASGPIPKTLDEALDLLKATQDKAAETPPFAAKGNEATRIKAAIALVESTGKYLVDKATYQVTFKPQTRAVTDTAGLVHIEQVKRKVDTIEDFILFVEACEQAYPSADVKQVTSEVRQTWFRDENWELLVNSQGIVSGSGATARSVDLRTDPATAGIDMADLKPSSGEKTISTPYGDIAISHVMAGMDAALSMSPKTMPPGGGNQTARQLKFDTLKASTGGDPRPFTTWAGGIGQCYAGYLIRKIFKGEAAVTLKEVMDVEADDAQLLGDIHGYIMIEEARSRRPVAKGKAETCSGFLRTFYLAKPAAGETYESGFMKTSGKSSADLRDFITERSMAFAANWYAKKELDARGGMSPGGWWKSKGWTAKGILEHNVKDFEDAHKKNEAAAAAADKLDAYVQHLLDMVQAKMQ